MGRLYLVGTPIGNLGDMTYRAVETLKSVDFICAEDTRVTAKLLNYFNIKIPLISYHEHNAKTAGKQVIDRILSGENAAIVTDAGMPCISTPERILSSFALNMTLKSMLFPARQQLFQLLPSADLTPPDLPLRAFYL